MTSQRTHPGDPSFQGVDRSRLGGLAGKVLLFVFTATVITAAAVGWVSIRSTSASLHGMVDRLYPQSAEHAAARMKPWIEGIRLHLEYLANHSMPEISGGLDPRFDGLASFDARGEPNGIWGEVPESSRQALKNPERVALVELGQGRFALAIAPRWRSRERELVAVVDLDRFASQLSVELPNDETLLALTDADGRILVRAGSLPGAPVLEWIDLDALKARGSLREIALAGTRMVGATQRLDLIGWHVALLTPHATAYGAVVQALQRVFLIEVGIIALFSLLAYLVTSRIVRPLHELAAASWSVARGESVGELEAPETRDEIGLLTRTFNLMLRRQREQREEIELANRNLVDQNSRLEQANEVLAQLSITDGLTKLHNHRFFQDHLTREIRRVERNQEPLAILVLDIDDFKRLNDQFGHAAGDEVLVRIAMILNDTVRSTDLCARYGGEEFVVLTPSTSMEGAYELAEKVRTAIAESSFIVDDSMRPLRATVSTGVARYDGDRKRFFQKADQALYRAKAEGKNCSVVAEGDWPEELGEPPAV